jgi:hypothetical protein
VNRQNEQAQAAPSFVETPESRVHLERLELLANWLDRRYIDAALGLFLPGAGDTLGALLGLYGVFAAFKMRVHPMVIARMLVNLAVDALVGTIPILGFVFDIFFQAHVRNLQLMKARGPHGPAETSDYVVVSGAVLLFLFALPLLLLGLAIVLLVKAFS